MATIDIHAEGSLLIVSVVGALSADEVITIIRDYYPNGIVKHVIWDLPDGSLSSITQAGYKSIAKAAKESVASGTRQGGKTAYVGGADAEYGLMRMYAVIAELAGVPINYSVYKTMAEAREWINEKP